MSILSVEKFDDSEIVGYTDDEGFYKKFYLTPDGELNFVLSIPKKDFRSLEYFAAIIGKFDPYAFIPEKPIVVER